MQEDRPPRFRRDLEDGEEALLVERRAVDVGMDLHAARAGRKRALELARRVARIHRQRCEPAAEMFSVFGDELWQPVIGDLCEFARGSLVAHCLDGRHAERDHLGVLVLALEAVDQREPLVDVVDRWDAGHAFGNILAADILHPLP
jgi:hypothetical protein